MSRANAATAAQAQALDTAAAEQGVSLDALMAVAGWQCARLARRLGGALPGPLPIGVLAGRGNNGADALGCARHLSAWGCQVRAVTFGDQTDLRASYARQALAAVASGVQVRPAGNDPGAAVAWVLHGAELIVDGLLGTGSAGRPRPGLAEAIMALNAASLPVLAVDLPSGLDATTGEVAGECVRAAATLMLAIAKAGCVAPESRRYAGRLWLADLGVPTRAYQSVGLTQPQFGSEGLGAYPSH